MKIAFSKPARDLATTRQGAVNYAVMRFLPKGVIERGVRHSIKRAAEKGIFRPTPMTEDLLARLGR